MQSVVVVLLFVGVVLVMQGIFEERIQAATRDVKIEYRFVPRTYYEEQLAGNDLSPSIKTLFTAGNADPWFDKSIGRPIHDAARKPDSHAPKTD